METIELSLHHIIRKPVNTSQKFKALFMFHGYGSNEHDLFSFAPELQDELFIISVQAPYKLQYESYAWYSIYFDAPQGKFSDDKQAVLSRDKISKFIDEAIIAYNLDSTNISLLGFSQGAILSYALALTYPNKIRNVIALSGYIHENIINVGNLSDDLSHLNVYCSHGSIDQVIPVEWARRTPDFLQKYGIQTSLNEFPVGHGVTPENFYQFKNWIESKVVP